ncbi:MAG TPA: hypothetical protein VFJ92_04785 [Gemmatimonadales bacterium]|nr:hypothetical protein [Gemmatimonadales bacterium]
MPERMYTMRTPLLLLLAPLALLACSDSSGPTDTTKPPADLNIVELSDQAPPLYNAEVSFYAVKGRDAEARIYFQDDEGKPGEEYLRLRVDAPSLQARPDGSAIAEGDSVLITVRVVDPAKMLFEMEPSGLAFSADKPAELKIRYEEARGDLNDDGRVDSEDDHIENTMAIWRQETPSDPFVRVGTAVVKEFEEADAELTGFSRYALAY